MRIAIADPSPIDRRIVERLVGRTAELEVVTSGERTPAASAVRVFDVLIADPASQEEVNPACLERIAALPPDVAVVLFTRAPAELRDWVERQSSVRAILLADKAAVGESHVAVFDREVLPWLLADSSPNAARRTTRAHSPRTTAAPPPASTKPAAAPPRPPAPTTAATGLRNLVVIGASTGGPAAIGDLLRALPGDLDAGICITQHMPDGFTRRFAERLNATTPFEVQEAIDGQSVVPGQVLIAPSGRHLELSTEASGVRALLTDAPPENWCRPAVDRLFRSAARISGPRTTAVVLTGMGKDGEAGSLALDAAGARIYVQDERTSVVWGMPGAVARAGVADAIEDIARLAERLVRECGTLGGDVKRRRS